MILVGDASGVRAPYAVRSLLRAGPKWKFESITLREVGRQPCILKSVAASCTVEADHGGWQLDLPMVFQAVR